MTATKDWPASAVVERRLADLVPRATNPRTHSPRQVERLAESIRQWGWTVPVLVDEAGGIIAGHGRVMAAERLGIEAVPCMVAEGWTEEQVRAYVVADNQLALAGGWDDELLAAELGELRGGGFDLELLGFDDKELRKMLGNGEVVQDEAPAVQDDPVTEVGDLWLLGRHRVLCGDCREVGVVDKVDLIYADPPYGMRLEVNRLKDAPKQDPRWNRRTYSPVAGDSEDFEFAATQRPKAREEIWWGADYYRATLPEEGSWYVWDKKVESADAMPGSGFELAWSAKVHKREIARFLWTGYRAREFGEGEGRVHPTQKPVALAAWFIDKFNATTVWDGFLGSGTTLIAAEQLGRTCYGIEIEPRYVDVVVRRWQEKTGRDATLEASGVTFAELELTR